MTDYLRAGALSGYIETVEFLGGEPLNLLAQAGLAPAQLRDPDNFIPYVRLAELIERTAEYFNMPYFGAHFSRQQGLSTVGLIGAYMTQQDTIGEALVCAQKYSHMHAQGSRLAINQLDEAHSELVINIAVNQLQQYPQLMQLSMGLVYNLMRDLAGPQWKAYKLSFKQTMPTQAIATIGDIFKCDVEFGAPEDSIHFNPEVLSLAPQKSDTLISAIIDNQFRRQQSTPPDNVQLVRHAINTLLPIGDCTKENIAQSLDIHPKKLERLLREHNTSYRSLLEQTRKRIAVNAMEIGNMSMTELALNLGYSEFSAFSRGFKNWFGVSPRRYIKNTQEAMINALPNGK